MKKLNLVITTIALILFAQIINAQTTGHIAGSAHDFSLASWNSTGEICKVCHTPHNAMTGVVDAPLWNHAMTTQTFTVYNQAVSATMNAVVGQPDGSSKLCLSCHDGVTAVNSFGGGTGAATPMTGANVVGVDLSNDHPVSFTYDAALATADGGLFNPATALSGLGGTINHDLLIGGKMQCSSCHDVHNNVAGSGSPAVFPANLLVKSNAASALCLTCHNK